MNTLEIKEGEAIDIFTESFRALCTFDKKVLGEIEEFFEGKYISIDESAFMSIKKMVADCNESIKIQYQERYALNKYNLPLEEKYRDKVSNLFYGEAVFRVLDLKESVFKIVGFDRNDLSIKIHQEKTNDDYWLPLYLVAGIWGSKEEYLKALDESLKEIGIDTQCTENPSNLLPPAFKQFKEIFIKEVEKRCQNQ